MIDENDNKNEEEEEEQERPSHYQTCVKIGERIRFVTLKIGKKFCFLFPQK